MKRFIEGEDRRQSTLLPDSLEDDVTEDNPVRVIDAFIDELGMQAVGFAGAVPEVTGRPAYHPATLLKIYSPMAVPGGPLFRHIATNDAVVSNPLVQKICQVNTHGDLSPRRRDRGRLADPCQ